MPWTDTYFSPSTLKHRTHELNKINKVQRGRKYLLNCVIFWKKVDPKSLEMLKLQPNRKERSSLEIIGKGQGETRKKSLRRLGWVIKMKNFLENKRRVDKWKSGKEEFSPFIGSGSFRSSGARVLATKLTHGK